MFPDRAIEGLLQLRRIIFDVAHNLPEIGRLEETLRWGQPAYLTPDRKAATTLRLGLHKSGDFALFAHCQSQVIPAFRSWHEAQYRFDGNRAVLFSTVNDIRPEHLSGLIQYALTYHLKS